MSKRDVFTKEVTRKTALLTYFVMLTLAMVLLMVPSLNKWDGSPFVLTLIPFFPLGLARLFSKTVGEAIAFVAAYGTYICSFFAFIFMRQRYAFTILVLVFFFVLCLNIKGCDQMHGELRNIQ